MVVGVCMTVRPMTTSPLARCPSPSHDPLGRCSALGDKRTIAMDSLHSQNPDTSPAVPFEMKQALGLSPHANLF